MRKFALAVVVLIVGACATLPPPDGLAGTVRSISYETGPCFGACPVYRLTVSADGEGRFVGSRFTAASGEQAFPVTGEQFAAFARQLAPLRPTESERRYSGEACEMTATDMPSTQVVWTDRDGSRRTLYFYHGCDMERNRPIAERLKAAPALLPIGELIGGQR
ncbi:DUF6438 domain-containing protein [Sphingosinicella sp. CPCC 101087]|uniref:DUF6438 domain-containing protein n=1 Tax=Sphingosinicella sp. CPCC 101087 TaxID=2497754 RepID=UPI00101C6A95|nr:DUF6438 domain-containing protein [Sphingosinicella sp. CPCC 101087]